MTDPWLVVNIAVPLAIGGAATVGLGIFLLAMRWSDRRRASPQPNPPRPEVDGRTT